MERKRILAIIPTLDQSGAEKQLALLATHLPKDRFDVSVCALTRGGYYEKMLKDGGVRVDIIGKRYKGDLRAFWRLVKLIREIQPDLVHTWLFAGNSYGRAAARWAKTPKIIASERCVDRWKRSFQFAIDRWLAKKTDAVVVNSFAVKAFYEKVGIDSEKLRVIENAVVETVPLAKVDRAAKLAELGLPADALIVGFIGRLWPQKKVQDLVWAVDVLRISGWNAHLLIVGEGPRRQALQEFTHNLALDQQVHFLGHRNDAAELLQIFDVFALASQFEGMPNVVLEAMQASKPVVATRIAGMDEVVAEGETGYLVPIRQPVEIAKAISRLLADTNLRATMGKAARERVNRQFSLGRMVNAYAKLYDEFLLDG